MRFICKLRAREWPHSKAGPETPYHAFPVPPPLTIPRRWLTALTAGSSHRSAVSSGWTWCPPHFTVWLSSAFVLSGDGHTRAYAHTLLKEMACLHFHFLSNAGWDCLSLPWASHGNLTIVYEYWTNIQMAAGSLCWHTSLVEGLVALVGCDLWRWCLEHLWAWCEPLFTAQEQQGPGRCLE